MSILPSLPTELISHIVDSASSPKSGINFSDKAQLLRACSLVSPEWQYYAQKNLYASIVLGDSQSARMFLQTLERRPDLAKRVTKIEVLEDGYEEVFREILNICENVVEIMVREVKGFKMAELQVLPRLLIFTAIRSTFSTPPSLTFEHRSLQNLSIVRAPSDPPTPCGLVPYITPTHLPALRLLGITSKGKCSPDEFATIKVIFPQLALLSLDTQELHSLGGGEIGAPVLYNLSIGLSASLGLPSILEIKYLRIRWNKGQSYENLTIQAVRSLTVALKANGPLRGLKTIFAPLLALEKVFPSIVLASLELRKMCESKGVRLVDEAECGGGEQQFTLSEAVISEWASI